MKFNFPTLLLFASLMQPLRAEAPSLDPVQPLFEQLRSDDFDERQDAIAKLLLRGPVLRARINAELALPGIHPDYRENLRTIVAGLRELELLQTYDAPPRIDLELKDQSVADALEKISLQFGQVVTASEGAGAKTITLSIKGATFMDAVNAVRRAAELEFAPGFSPTGFISESEETLRRFKNLSLRTREAGGVETSAVNGPFAVVLTRIEGQERVPSEDMPRISYTNIAGNIYFPPNILLSRMRVGSLKAIDGEKEYNVIVANGFAGALHFHRVWSGKTAASGSFLCSFSGMVRTTEKVPTGLKWKMTLTAEIPLAFSDESIDISPTGFGVVQPLQVGTMTVSSLQESAGEWTLACLLSTRAYSGLLLARRGFNAISEGPPFGTRNLNLYGFRFFDENGASIIWRQQMRGVARENGQTLYKLDLKLDAKPKSLLITRTIKSVTRDFEFEFPAVPVPLTKTTDR